MEIELEPDLSHCIQTLAKREYDQIMSHLLETNADNPELGEILEILKLFLESTDFNKLRTEYEPYLVQGKKVTFTLCTQADNTKYRMEIE
ncbi:MAG: hypothetical protein HQ553_13115 [Chloroflexi bacterium]|nr:hypothetical protein [Chloroflexota bacterium]